MGAATLPLPGTETPGWLNVRDFGASGSAFETGAATTAGARDVVVANPGDFRVGQGVMLEGAFRRFTAATLMGPRVATRRPLPGGVLEMRGYDGSEEGWKVYLLEILPGNPARFRWTDDLGRNWHEDRPLVSDWQELSAGVEIRFLQVDWEEPHALSFHARDLLASRIEAIDGSRLTLRDAPNLSNPRARLRHCDTESLQAALDAAVERRANVHVPRGTYRLSRGLFVRDATALVLEGAGSTDTVLDISAAGSSGEYTCLTLVGGTEVTLRNFTMLGHTGFDRRDQAGGLRLRGLTGLWGFYLKGCNAVAIRGTERVLVENCHASRMASECFYSQSPSRRGREEPGHYTKSITYLRCSVTDSARNAFNNNDGAENTSILQCRVVDVGGNAWEGASRFVRIKDSYFRNAGPIAMGNVGGRSAHLEELGRAQHIVADNVFEDRRHYGRQPGGFMIHAAAAATQLIIRNNLFVNFNSSGIRISSNTGPRDLPASTALVTGNIIDLTSLDETPLRRTGIHITASDVVVSDNQIYVRGEPDPLVTGITLGEPAVNLIVHNNLLRHCGTGLSAERAASHVTRVLDDTTFLAAGRWVPYERRQSHRYRGWNLAWLGGSPPGQRSVIDFFDPETLRFHLRSPHPMKAGDRFEVFPVAANWNVHHNTITACLRPVVLDAHGSETSYLRSNVITRGDVAGARQAVEVHGRFRLRDNEFHGFDSPLRHER